MFLRSLAAFLPRLLRADRDQVGSRRCFAKEGGCPRPGLVCGTPRAACCDVEPLTVPEPDRFGRDRARRGGAMKDGQ